MRTVFEPLGAEFSSVIITGLFAANEPRPGDPWGLTSRKRAPIDDQQRVSYMAAWYHTIKNCGWYAVILHDGLSRAFIETWETPRIRFAYFPGDSDAPHDWSFRYPPHERRFFAARTFLAHQSHVRFAFLTDINSGGILVKADPQKFFTAAHGHAPAGTLAFDDLVFVSEENQPMFRDGVMRPFWRDHTALCDPAIRELFAAWPFAQSLCVGIWGAATATARAVLTDLTNGLVRQRESERRILVPIDQVVFMDVLYRRYFARLVNFYSGTPRLWYQGDRCLLNDAPYAWFQRGTAPPLLIADACRIPIELQGRDDTLQLCAELFFSPIGRGPALAQHDVRWWRPGDLQGTEPVRYKPG